MPLPPLQATPCKPLTIIDDRPRGPRKALLSGVRCEPGKRACNMCCCKLLTAVEQAGKTRRQTNRNGDSGCCYVCRPNAGPSLVPNDAISGQGDRRRLETSDRPASEKKKKAEKNQLRQDRSPSARRERQTSISAGPPNTRSPGSS